MQVAPGRACLSCLKNGIYYTIELNDKMNIINDGLEILSQINIEAFNKAPLISSLIHSTGKLLHDMQIIVGRTEG